MFFAVFRTSYTNAWEIRNDQHIKLKIIHVYLILFNNMPPKFQVIVLITYCFIAFFVSDIFFAHRECLTLEMKFKTFPKVSILEKTWFWLFGFTHLAESLRQQFDIIWLYYAKFSGLYLSFWPIGGIFAGSRFFFYHLVYNLTLHIN